MQVRIRRDTGQVIEIDESRFVDPRNAAAMSDETLRQVLDGSVAIADVEPRICRLGGDGDDPLGWKLFHFPGPGLLRSMQVRGGDFTSSGTLPFQVNTFLASPGVRRPIDRETTIQSNGVGALAIPFGGPWWISPIRLDVKMSVCYQPLLSPDVAAGYQAIDGCGLGNLHSHYGISLLTAANDAGDNTIPAPDTFMEIGGYRARKALTIHLPRRVFVGTWNGTTQTKWIGNTGDTVVDQEGIGAIVGWSTFIQAGNLGQYNTWHLPSDLANALGNGLNPLLPGDRLEFIGVSRWVGPVLLFNLNLSAPAKLTIEEYT